MLKYICKRILALFLVVLGVTLVIYLIMYLLPGDVTQFILGQNYTPEGAASLREKLGLDQPFLVQFFRYVLGLLHGDFGNSYVSGDPVEPLLMSRFPRTLILVLISIGLCTIISVPMGVYAALQPRSFLSYLIQAFGMVGVALPSFWLGLMLM
ncbi:MAG: ABC transporter permease, partial [Lachnospiraceae bacterium]|nr:ABC transporter permease [Lachnospiraceae bacterium]